MYVFFKLLSRTGIYLLCVCLKALRFALTFLSGLGVGCEMSVCSHTEIAYCILSPPILRPLKVGQHQWHGLTFLEVNWISDPVKVWLFERLKY